MSASTGKCSPALWEPAQSLPGHLATYPSKTLTFPVGHATFQEWPQFPTAERPLDAVTSPGSGAGWVWLPVLDLRLSTCLSWGLLKISQLLFSRLWKGDDSTSTVREDREALKNPVCQRGPRGPAPPLTATSEPAPRTTRGGCEGLRDTAPLPTAEARVLGHSSLPPKVCVIVSGGTTTFRILCLITTLWDRWNRAQRANGKTMAKGHTDKKRRPECQPKLSFCLILL